MGVVLSFIERKRRKEAEQAEREAHLTVIDIANSLRQGSAYEEWLNTHCLVCGRDLHPKMIELNRKVTVDDDWDHYEAATIELDMALQAEGSIDHVNGCELCGLTGGSAK